MPREEAPPLQGVVCCVRKRHDAIYSQLLPRFLDVVDELSISSSGTLIMGSTVSSPYNCGSSDNHPNKGISKVYLPADISESTRGWILEALEHRFYHRFIEAEATLVDLISHVESIRDLVHALIHLAILRTQIGICIPHSLLVILSCRLSALHKVNLPEDPDLWAAVDKWRLTKEAAELPLVSKLNVETIELRSITESERDLIYLLGLPISNTWSNIEEKERFLVDIFKRRCAVQSSTEPWLEHELYIHYMYHLHIYDTGKNSPGSQTNVQVLAVISRLITEERFDAVLEFQGHLSDHSRYRDRVKPLYLTMLGHPSVTKHQHVSGRMFIAESSASYKSTHIQEDEIRRLMKECNDPLYSTVPEPSRWPQKHRAYMNDTLRSVAGLNQISEEVKSLIALKCYQQAASRSRLVIWGWLGSNMELEWNSFFRYEMLNYMDLHCGKQGASVEAGRTLFSVCLDRAIKTGREQVTEKVANTISVIRFFHGGVASVNSSWQPWTVEGMVQIAWEIVNKVEDEFLGTQLATEAARFCFEQTRIASPGSDRESRAAYKLLRQMIESAFKVSQENEGLAAIGTACDEAEAFALTWIEIDQSKERYELAFEKAWYMAYLVIVDPNRYIEARRNGGGTKATSLMYELGKKTKWMSGQENYQIMKVNEYRKHYDECKFANLKY